MCCRLPPLRLLDLARDSGTPALWVADLEVGPLVGLHRADAAAMLDAGLKFWWHVG